MDLPVCANLLLLLLLLLLYDVQQVVQQIHIKNRNLHIDICAAGRIRIVAQIDTKSK